MVGDRVFVDMNGPSKVANSKELVDYMADSPKAKACFGRRMMEFTKIRTENLETDRCTLAEIEKNMDQPIESVWVGSIANEDIFWRSAE